MEQSLGHICFDDNVEYFTRGNGDLFRAPISDAIMPDGYRCGRWEAPKHLADKRLSMLGIN